MLVYMPNWKFIVLLVVEKNAESIYNITNNGCINDTGAIQVLC